MKPEIKTKWVAALRSGEYKQGQGYLRNTDGTYCCLGVLCDLAAREGIGAWCRGDENVIFVASNDEYDTGLALLPEAVADWAGLHDNKNPTVIDATGDRYCLASLNDTGTSFVEIADLIEKGL